MGPNPGVDVEGMPVPVLLRIKDPPPTTRRAADLLGAAFSDTVSLTSDRAAALAGLVAELAGDGRGVGLNTFSRHVALAAARPLGLVSRSIRLRPLPSWRLTAPPPPGS